MLYVIVQKECVPDVKKGLSVLGLMPKGVRNIQLLNGDLAIPLLAPERLDETSADESIMIGGKLYGLKEAVDLPPLRIRKPYALMKKKLEDLMRHLGLWSDNLALEIPSSWVKYGDLVVINPQSFEDPVWKKAGDGVWKTICQSLKVKRVGKLHKVIPDSYRTPKLEIIYGSKEWVHITDNQIRYTWDARFCMFSAGNATERARVSRMDCRNDTIVDMYAGIGYFTLPFLVHAKAKYVHACEWNPSALAALRKNLAINNVSNRCQIHKGDCRLVAPSGVADRVYLGLIPSCVSGILGACMALKNDTGGMLHLHANVSSYKKKRDASGVRKVMDDISTLNIHSIVNSDTSVDKSLSEGIDSFDGNTCSECQNLEKVFPPDLLSYIEHSWLKPDGRNDQRCSFVLWGNEGIPSWFPEAEVLWKKREWFVHAYHLAHLVFNGLFRYHKQPWRVAVSSVHHVKSYAPHIDHLVYDMHCVPDLEESDSDLD